MCVWTLHGNSFVLEHNIQAMCFLLGGAGVEKCLLRKLLLSRFCWLVFLSVGRLQQYIWYHLGKDLDFSTCSFKVGITILFLALLFLLSFSLCTPINYLLTTSTLLSNICQLETVTDSKKDFYFSVQFFWELEMDSLKAPLRLISPPPTTTFICLPSLICQMGHLNRIFSSQAFFVAFVLPIRILIMKLKATILTSLHMPFSYVYIIKLAFSI